MSLNSPTEKPDSPLGFSEGMYKPCCDSAVVILSEKGEVGIILIDELTFHILGFAPSQ